MAKSDKKRRYFSPEFKRDAVALGISTFLKLCLFKRGFLMGLDGLTISLGMALTSYLKHAWLIEYRRDAGVREAEDFESAW